MPRDAQRYYEPLDRFDGRSDRDCFRFVPMERVQRFLWTDVSGQLITNIEDCGDLPLSGGEWERQRDAAEALDVRMDRALLRALKTLPPRQREAILLYFYAGKTKTEIAQIMNISHQRVCQLIEAGKTNLLKYFDRTSSRVKLRDLWQACSRV